MVVYGATLLAVAIGVFLPGHPLGWPVALVEPARALVLRSEALPVGTYAYVLEPTGDGATRLLVFEPLHAYMETGVLRGIKARVERAKAAQGASSGPCGTAGVRHA